MTELTCADCEHAIDIEGDPYEDGPLGDRQFVHQRCYSPVFSTQQKSFGSGESRRLVNNHRALVGKTEVFRTKRGKINPKKSVVVLSKPACDKFEPQTPKVT
jgi:hypothetical protein|tara:strand:+ start:363 stop:668 length:306 start_codon:yes stop_codon:yes gene_type:complete